MNGDANRSRLDEETRLLRKYDALVKDAPVSRLRKLAYARCIDAQGDEKAARARPFSKKLTVKDVAELLAEATAQNVEPTKFSHVFGPHFRNFVQRTLCRWLRPSEIRLIAKYADFPDVPPKHLDSYHIGFMAIPLVADASASGIDAKPVQGLVQSLGMYLNFVTAKYSLNYMWIDNHDNMFVVVKAYGFDKPSVVLALLNVLERAGNMRCTCVPPAKRTSKPAYFCDVDAQKGFFPAALWATSVTSHVDEWRADVPTPHGLFVPPEAAARNQQGGRRRQSRVHTEGGRQTRTSVGCNEFTQGANIGGFGLGKEIIAQVYSLPVTKAPAPEHDEEEDVKKTFEEEKGRRVHRDVLHMRTLLLALQYEGLARLQNGLPFGHYEQYAVLVGALANWREYIQAFRRAHPRLRDLSRYVSDIDAPSSQTQSQSQSRNNSNNNATSSRSGGAAATATTRARVRQHSKSNSKTTKSKAANTQ